MAEHVCVDCRALPELPPDAPKPRGSRIRAGFRPPKPLAVVSGGPRSQRCTIHARAHRYAQRVAARTAHKARRFGLTAELQAELWALQGSACPCGAKFSPGEIPAGVAAEHDHEYAAEHCAHDPASGCPECVLGMVCAHCNTEIIGRLTGRTGGRAGALAALVALAEFMNDPPMARLRRALTEVPA